MSATPTNTVSAIVQLLLSTPAVTALVGTRVYSGSAPQADSTQGGPYPYCVCRKSSAEHVRHYQGRAGLVADGIEIGCYDRSYSGAEDLRDVVSKAVDCYTGSPAGWGQTIRGIFVHDESDQVSGPIHADEQGVMEATVEATVWRTE